MIVNSPDKVSPSEAVKSSSKLVLLLTGLFLICFFVSFWEQARKPLWMDEVLAVWVAQLPTAHDVVSALYHGAEFSPPTYHLLLYALTHGTGHAGYRMLRLPSILATAVSGLCLFALIRRYCGVHAAGFGIAFALLSFWSDFGLEIRPYALVLACFACAVLLWDGLEEHRQPLWRVGLIAACLAGAVSLHFYSVLLVACVGMMEIIWSYRYRRLRLPVWIGLAAAGSSLLMWLPLMRTLSRYNTGDTASPRYYAQPVFDRLLDTYVAVSVCGKRQILFFAAALCLTAAVCLANKVRLPKGSTPEPHQDPEKLPGTNFSIIAFCAIAYPSVVYLFAALITKTYNTRYSLAGGLGFALLAAFLISRISAFRPAIAPILGIACALAFIRPEPVGAYANVWEVNSVLAHATKPYPIVVSEGLEYFQLREGLPDALQSRLVYVTAPESVASPDPTNENQVKRWIPLRRDLKIVDAKTFLAQNRHFYVLHTAGSVGVLTQWLLENGMLQKPVANLYDIWLFEGESR